MTEKLIIYWFKTLASKAAKKALVQHYKSEVVKEILHGYWQRYLELKAAVPAMPTLGGNVMVHLAAMSTAFYQELTARGQTEVAATQLFYEIAWKIYVKMGKLSWWLAGWGKSNNYEHLLKATQLFRSFPFNSPSYDWQEVKTAGNIVGFNCVKCPVADYFQSQGLSKFCVKTWCSLDYPLAEMWHAKLERNGSIAGGAIKCDFRWIVDSEIKIKV